MIAGMIRRAGAGELWAITAKGVCALMDATRLNQIFVTVHLHSVHTSSGLLITS